MRLYNVVMHLLFFFYVLKDHWRHVLHTFLFCFHELDQLHGENAEREAVRNMFHQHHHLKQIQQRATVTSSSKPNTTTTATLSNNS